MSKAESCMKTAVIGALAGALLFAPWMARPVLAHAASFAPATSWQDQDNSDRAQEAQERAQEQREREQEARDRAQEKKDRAQEQVERLDELYSDGREALDEDRYDRAADRFSQLAELNGPQTDAALYWKAYAENKLGKRDVALTTIADMKKRFPQSRWLKDASALDIEVRQSTGHPANPENQSDEDLKMLALQGIMQSDPSHGVPMVEKFLNGSESPRLKSKALFLLAQNGSPQARDVLAKMAKGDSNPDLQRKAVEYLGLFGGQEARQTLAQVYSSSSDASIKRAILKAYMLGGDKQHLLEAAKGEKDETLRMDAIRQLGLVHAPAELRQLYQAESSPDVKKAILQAFFLSGDAKFLLEAAQGEKDPDVRRSAIHNLGLIGSDEARQALPALYTRETDRDNKEAVLNALFIQGNAHGLVTIARGEKDPELKKMAVSKLALMNSKEGNDYLMEILQK
ncbi:MAG TPA: HEAT repeat domain-containing protein [Candidatus Acidoferrum sp.]|nr:HEAT repeat domain-containing protein [Candidatus Acidoferrum sp.]